MQNITNTFIYHMVPLIAPSCHNTKCISINTRCVSHCFNLQFLPATDRWEGVYNDDTHTKVLIDRLFISVSLDEPTIINLPAAYRTNIVLNLLGLLEDRLAYYEPIITVNNYICLIVIPTFLCRVIFNMIYALRFFWPKLWSDTSN